jgi:hypothetical protein
LSLTRSLPCFLSEQKEFSLHGGFHTSGSSIQVSLRPSADGLHVLTDGPDANAVADVVVLMSTAMFWTNDD